MENDVLDGGMFPFIQHGQPLLIDWNMVRHRSVVAHIVRRLAIKYPSWPLSSVVFLEATVEVKGGWEKLAGCWEQFLVRKAASWAE